MRERQKREYVDRHGMKLKISNIVSPFGYKRTVSDGAIGVRRL